jgi:hypothetical protein
LPDAAARRYTRRIMDAMPPQSRAERVMNYCPDDRAAITPWESVKTVSFVCFAFILSYLVLGTYGGWVSGSPTEVTYVTWYTAWRAIEVKQIVTPAGATTSTVHVSVLRGVFTLLVVGSTWAWTILKVRDTACGKRWPRLGPTSP